ncbi:MAG: hypothetical protein CFH35_01646 [Alphaproteobacteria bacterium MarineAlpha9_Bin5]|nr:MAG: hypothetical protein CFH36_00433 [Alphaproteobacteria bacterium MarineAlpha9_Bin6]PPR36931.1 MAG: hypothetical protein CFH35_01646 [Alphaproteobacteria bacterium MarineAlpha9_Bin5]HIO03345.1 DUF58 domain-containing protein [Alphaproteobacteria bacterium]
MAKSAQDLQRRAESIAVPFPPLLIAAQRVAASVFQGVHGRRRSGPGETFWQFRRYQPTDPVSLIDWRQSAKSQRVYVREQEWEASQSVWLWCDRSPSMEYHSKEVPESKAIRAKLLLLALASLLLRAGEQVGLVQYGGKPLRGNGALPRLAEAITGQDAIPQISTPPRMKLPRHAHVVLISDFLEPPGDLEDIIKWFAGQGLAGHLAQVLDPAEETLPFTGRARFTGLEGEGETVIGRVEAVRADYSKRLTLHRENLSAITSRTGWNFLSHRTDRPPEMALLSLYLTLSGSLGRLF